MVDKETIEIDEEAFEFEDEVIVLQDEDGNEIEFNHIATIDYNNEWYIFLQPVELGDLEDDEMIVFRIDTDEEGNDMYVPIEDEATINALYEEYEKEYMNFSGCGDDEEGCSGCSGCDCSE